MHMTSSAGHILQACSAFRLIKRIRLTQVVFMSRKLDSIVVACIKCKCWIKSTYNGKIDENKHAKSIH